jgi:hypothetical protein
MRVYLNRTFPDYSEVDLTGFPDEDIKSVWQQMARRDRVSNAELWDLIDYMDRHRSSPYVAQAAGDAYVFMVGGVNIYPAYKVVSEQHQNFFKGIPMDCLLSCGRFLLAKTQPELAVIDLFKEFNLICYGVQL